MKILADNRIRLEIQGGIDRLKHQEFIRHNEIKPTASSLVIKPAPEAIPDIRSTLVVIPHVVKLDSKTLVDKYVEPRRKSIEETNRKEPEQTSHPLFEDPQAWRPEPRITYEQESAVRYGAFGPSPCSGAFPWNYSDSDYSEYYAILSAASKAVKIERQMEEQQRYSQLPQISKEEYYKWLDSPLVVSPIAHMRSQQKKSNKKAYENLNLDDLMHPAGPTIWDRVKSIAENLGRSLRKKLRRVRRSMRPKDRARNSYNNYDYSLQGAAPMACEPIDIPGINISSRQNTRSLNETINVNVEVEEFFDAVTRLNNDLQCEDSEEALELQENQSGSSSSSDEDEFFDADEDESHYITSVADPVSVTRDIVRMQTEAPVERILQADFNQTDVSDTNCGNQCTAIVGIGLGYSQVRPVKEWNRGVLNAIMFDGNDFYNVLRIRNITEEFLQPSEVAGTISFNGQLAHVTPLEDRGWHGMRDGYLSNNTPTLSEAIRSFIQSQYTQAFLVTADYTFGLMMDSNKNHLYLLDSHARDNHGRISPDGVACLLRYNADSAPESLSDLIHKNVGLGDAVITSLAQELRNQFSVLPVDSANRDQGIITWHSGILGGEREDTQIVPPAVHVHGSSLAEQTVLETATTPSRGTVLLESSEIFTAGDEFHIPGEGLPFTKSRTKSGTCDGSNALGTKCRGRILDMYDIPLETAVLMEKRARACAKHNSLNLVKVCMKHKSELTGHFKSNQKKKGCVNPLGIHQMAWKRGVRPVNIAEEFRFRKFFPFIIGGMYICPTCRIKALTTCDPVHTTEKALCGTSSSGTSRSSSQAIKDPTVSDSNGGSSGSSQSKANIEGELAGTLESLGLSPLCTKQRRGKRKPEVQRKWNLAEAILKRKFQRHEEWETPKPKRSKTDNMELNKDKEVVDKFMAEMVTKFEAAANKKDKYQILTSTPGILSAAALFRHFSCTLHEARTAASLRRQLGPFSFPTPHVRAGIPTDTITLVKEFYLDQDNSRPAAGATETRTVRQDGHKRIVAKQYMLLTLVELHRAFLDKYEESNISIGLSTFAKLRPKECYWMGQKGHHVSCTCKTHENFKLLMQCIGEKEKLGGLLAPLVCDLDSEKCMLSFCSECPRQNGIDIITCQIDVDEVYAYSQWARTDRTDLRDYQEDGRQLITRIEEFVPTILQHHFIAKKQQVYVKEVKHSLKENPGSFVVQMDFSENYTCIFQDQVHSYRWSNVQTTLHPFYITSYDHTTDKTIEESFVVISDNLGHDSNAVAAYISKLVQYLQEKYEVNRITYVSDGCGGQYKNYKNFMNLLYHERDHGVTVEWHFSATAHGKSQCDAVGGILKAGAKRHSLRPNCFIRSPLEFFDYCCKYMDAPNRAFVFVSAQEITEYATARKLASRYLDARTIPGTRSFHSYVPLNANTLQLRRFSQSDCFINHVMLREDEAEETETPYQIGEYILVRVDKAVQLEMIIEDNEDGSYQVNYMRRHNTIRNSFTWPSNRASQIEHTVIVAEIIRKVNIPCTRTVRQFNLNAADANFLE